MDGSGNVYVADRNNDRIQVFRPVPPKLVTVYVDFATGSPDSTGEVGDPVDSLGVALTIVEVGGLIKINAGSSSDTATIDTAVTIERNGSTGTVTIGAAPPPPPLVVDAQSGFVTRVVE